MTNFTDLGSKMAGMTKRIADMEKPWASGNQSFDSFSNRDLVDYLNLTHIDSLFESLPQIDLGENLSNLPSLKESLESFPSGGYLSLASILGLAMLTQSLASTSAKAAATNRFGTPSRSPPYRGYPSRPVYDPKPYYDYDQELDYKDLYSSSNDKENNNPFNSLYNDEDGDYEKFHENEYYGEDSESFSKEKDPENIKEPSSPSYYKDTSEEKRTHSTSTETEKDHPFRLSGTGIRLYKDGTRRLKKRRLKTALRKRKKQLFKDGRPPVYSFGISGGPVFPSFDSFDTNSNSYIGKPPRRDKGSKKGEKTTYNPQDDLTFENSYTDSNEELDYYENDSSAYGDLPLYEKDIDSFDAEYDDQDSYDFGISQNDKKEETDLDSTSPNYHSLNSNLTPEYDDFYLNNFNSAVSYHNYTTLNSKNFSNLPEVGSTYYQDPPSNPSIHQNSYQPNEFSSYPNYHEQQNDHQKPGDNSYIPATTEPISFITQNYHNKHNYYGNIPNDYDAKQPEWQGPRPKPNSFDEIMPNTFDYNSPAGTDNSLNEFDGHLHVGVDNPGSSQQTSFANHVKPDETPPVNNGLQNQPYHPKYQHFLNTDFDFDDYDVDFYVDNNYEYIDTQQVNDVKALFEKNRKLNEKYSEDISKVEIEFEKLDYENYDYLEKGILDFSKPPTTKKPKKIPVNFSKRRIRRPSKPRHSMSGNLPRYFLSGFPRRHSFSGSQSRLPVMNRSFRQRGFPRPRRPKWAYVPLSQIQTRVGTSPFLDGLSSQFDFGSLATIAGAWFIWQNFLVNQVDTNILVDLVNNVGRSQSNSLDDIGEKVKVLIEKFKTNQQIRNRELMSSSVRTETSNQFLRRTRRSRSKYDF